MWNKVGAQPAFFVVAAGSPACSRASSGRGRRHAPHRRRVSCHASGGPKGGLAMLDRQLWELCEPPLASLGLELDDLVVTGRGRRLLRITVDRRGGVDVQTLADVSRALARRLDDLDLFEGPYSLEVTSPGLERSLRRPLHYAKSVGRDVTVNTSVEVDGSRHHRGVLQAVGEDSFIVTVDGTPRRIAFGEVRAARTRFEWKKQPKSARKPG